MSKAKEYLKRVGLLQSPYISQERVIKHLEAFANEQIKAITVTHCCKSDSEQLPVLNRCECFEPQEEPIKICTNCNGYLE